MAGRRPKPRQLKLVTGNPGHRPIPDDEPQPVPGAPDKPRGLSKHAAPEWDRLIQELEGEQRLSKADRGHILGAAVAYGTAQEFAIASRRRRISNDEWRKLKTSERIQWDTYRKFLNDLCLSQGTRARAKTGGRGQQTSKLGAFFAKRAARSAKPAS